MQHADDFVTADEAESRLTDLDQIDLSNSKDQWLHAVGTVLVGAVTGAIFVAGQRLSPGQTTWVAGFGCLIIIALVQRWTSVASKTVPRRFGKLTAFALAGSLLVALAVVMPILNQRAKDGQNSIPLLVLGAAVIALPWWVAAAALVKR